MYLLSIRLFGGLALYGDNRSLAPVPGTTTRSLLAYLVTYRDRPHTRNLLAGTFWPDLPDATARRRLSQALWRIRRALPSHPILLTEGDTVLINPDHPLDRPGGIQAASCELSAARRTTCHGQPAARR